MITDEDKKKGYEQCKTCQAPIRWATTVAGKKIPLDLPPKRFFVIEDGLAVSKKGYTTHFATCPYAHLHRKKERRANDKETT